MLTLLVALGIAATQSALVARIDLGVVGAARASAFDPLTEGMLAVTSLGGTQMIVPVTVAALAVLALRRQWRGSLALLLAVSTTQLAVTLVKEFVLRPRPPADEAVVHAAGFSFPSGHAAVSLAVYATLAFLLARALRGRARLAAIAAGALLILAVGASRVYLGAHYPTDVAAGWLTGGALAIVAWALALRVQAPGPRSLPG